MAVCLLFQNMPSLLIPCACLIYMTVNQYKISAQKNYNGWHNISQIQMKTNSSTITSTIKLHKWCATRCMFEKSVQLDMHTVECIVWLHLSALLDKQKNARSAGSRRPSLGASKWCRSYMQELLVCLRPDHEANLQNIYVFASCSNHQELACWSFVWEAQATMLQILWRP